MIKNPLHRIKKLELRTQTIRRLDDADLRATAGGQAATKTEGVDTNGDLCLTGSIAGQRTLC